MQKFPHNLTEKVQSRWDGQLALVALKKIPSMHSHLSTTTRFSLAAASLHPFSLERMDMIPISSDLMIWTVSLPSPTNQMNGISVNRSVALVSILLMHLH